MLYYIHNYYQKNGAACNVDNLRNVRNFESNVYLDNRPFPAKPNYWGEESMVDF